MAYFVLIAAVGGGVVWPVHLWAGRALLAGLHGLGASYAVRPPAILRNRRVGRS